MVGAPLLDQLALVPDGKADVGPGQRVAAHRLDAVRQFGGVALEELAPRRGGVKQLAHLDCGAHAARRRLQLAGAPVQQPAVGLGGLGAARAQAELGNRVDGGQRLTPETHGGHGFELGQIAHLAGGVALERQRELVARDAAAVVLDHDQAHAAGLQPQRELARPGVERVVDQLAQHRSRALDHLTGGDLADERVGQLADRPLRLGAGAGSGRCGGGAVEGGGAHAGDCRGGLN